VPLTNVIKIHIALLFTLHNTKNIAHHITEVLIFYADKLMVMGNSKNLCVFNFVILLKSRKFYIAKYTCFTVIYTYYRSFFHFVTMHAFDRWTDTFVLTRPPCIQCSVVKMIRMAENWANYSVPCQFDHQSYNSGTTKFLTLTAPWMKDFVLYLHDYKSAVKKRDVLFLTISLANLNRFLKFLYNFNR